MLRELKTVLLASSASVAVTLGTLSALGYPQGNKELLDDISALKKTSGEFQREIQSLGVDVEAMKKDLGDVGQRLSFAEKASGKMQGEIKLTRLLQLSLEENMRTSKVLETRYSEILKRIDRLDKKVGF